MKKILSLSLIVLSALFLSGCGVKPNNDSATTTPSEVNQDSASSLSLRDLIAKNIPQKCLWTTTDSNGTKTTGTMIINGQKFNQQVVIEEKDSTITMHIISDGTWIYSWQENSLAKSPIPAMKMKFEETQAEAKDLEESVKEAQNNESSFGSVIDYDNKTEYNCSPTIVSGSEFQPPQNIEFIDYSQFLEDIQSKMPSINPSSLE